MKKPFKETKFGRLLLEKIPEAAKVVGNVLPDNGILGIAKNIIEGSTLSGEEKLALMNAAHEFELTELQEYLKDKQNARWREMEMAKTGKIDFLHLATGLTVIFAFIASVVSIIFVRVPPENKELFIHLLGIVEGAFVGGLVFYYFGSSHYEKKSITEVH